MKTLTVVELTRHIKKLLENDRLMANLWVKGEVSNLKRATSGHLYMTLKDQNATVRVVMFRSRARYLKYSLENGMAVRVRGSVTVFEQAGQYQLYAEAIEPDGEGALFAALERLKQQLAAEGLFDTARKQKLPRFPGCIGLVTSPTGAVIRDMLHILRRRWPRIRIILAPVAVQGESAPEEVARAIGLLNKLTGIDLIIVGRGGGSLEELWAFNSERVARSIAGSVIPIISAVGHETDFTIADLVADLRAPTPSAAAEMAVPDRTEMAKHLDLFQSRLLRSLKQKTATLGQRLERCATSRVLTRPVETMCNQRRQAVDLWDRQMVRALSEIKQNKSNQLALAAGRLNALSPLATLARGYSIVTGPGGLLLREAGQVIPGNSLNVYLHKGMLQCTVHTIQATKDKDTII